MPGESPVTLQEPWNAPGAKLKSVIYSLSQSDNGMPLPAIMARMVPSGNTRPL
jgi:hypothetical protein